MKKTFNLIIAGTGGQGLITLLQVIAESALIEGYDVKTAELHGLSQRGGSINTHIRMGKKVDSPLIPANSADVVISLELLETLRVVDYINSETVFLINNYSFPFLGTIPEDEILKKIEKLIKKRKYIISASEICQKELGKEILSGIYLISYAVNSGLIPINPESLKRAIKKIIPSKYLDINLKAFKLASTCK